MERSTFVFEQVYGDDYEIVLDECYESNRPSDEIYEEQALATAREIFDPVIPGDLDDIDQRLAEYGAIPAQ